MSRAPRSASADLPELAAGAPVLALDGASPVASAAIARAGTLLAEVALPAARSSGALLALIAAALRAADLAVADLGALVALRGPGSFTGTRVTLATATGLRLGGVPLATAVTNLEVLALAAPAAFRRPLAAVDALRGDWFLQAFELGPDGPEARGEPALAGPEAAPPAGVDGLVGFALAGLAGRWPELPRSEPAALAGAAALAASRGRWPWDASRLVHPLYLRPPAARRAG